MEYRHAGSIGQLTLTAPESLSRFCLKIDQVHLFQVYYKLHSKTGLCISLIRQLSRINADQLEKALPTM